MKFDPKAFRAPGLTGVTAVAMLLSSGTLAWSGGILKNPYTPKDTDPVDRAPVTHPGPAENPFAALKKAVSDPSVTVRISEQATSGDKSFATALPAAQNASGTASGGIVTGGEVAPRISLQVQGGSERGIATADLFLPFYQTGSSVAFFDLRGIATTQEEFEGNLGIGYRQVVGEVFGEEAVAGAYAFFDLRQTPNDNTYYQGQVGLEFLTDTIEARVNGYLPNSDRNVIQQGGASVGLVGTTVTTLNVASIVEQSLPGFDAELGFNLDLSDDLRVTATGGYFHFERDDIRAAGPKARLELAYDDPFGFDGAVLTFGGEFRHDEIRDTEANGFMRLSIPLGANPTPRRDLSKRAKKLGRYVYRDVDILAPTVVDEANRAPNEEVLGAPLPEGSAPGAPSAEDEVLNVYHVADAPVGAADCTSAANACTVGDVKVDPLYGAGDTIIVVDSAGSTIASDLTLDFDLNSVLGAGPDGTVAFQVPDAAGTLLTLSDLGGPVTLLGTVNPFNGTRLSQFDIDGGRGAAIQIDRDLGVGTVRVEDVQIVGGEVGLDISGSATGAITVDSLSSFSGLSDRVINSSAASFEATINAPITHEGAGAAVSIIGHQSGTFEFNNSITATPTGGDGIFITSTGPGSSIVFTGDLDIHAAQELAVNASSVTGSLSILDSADVELTTEQGAALSLAGVTIGTDGFHVDRIEQSGPGGTRVPVQVSGTSGGLIDLGDVTITGTDTIGVNGPGTDGVSFTSTQNTITASSITVDDVSGDGIEIVGTNSLIAIDQVDIDGAGEDGIFISGLDGTVDIKDGTIGSETSNSTGVEILGGAGTITIGADITSDGFAAVDVDELAGGSVVFGGTVTAKDEGQNGIILSEMTGGTVDFDGLVDIDLTGDSVSGISGLFNSGGTVNFNDQVDIDLTGDLTAGAFFVENKGAAFAFLKGLDITVGTGVGLGAVEGGVFEIAPEGTNQITSKGGVALRLENVTIADGGVQFDSITATDAPETPVLITAVSGGEVKLDVITIDGVAQGVLPDVGAPVDKMDKTLVEPLTEVFLDGMVIFESSATFDLGEVDIQNAAGIGLVLSGANGDVTIDELLLNGNGVPSETIVGPGDVTSPIGVTVIGKGGDDALLIEGATNDVTILSGNIGGDAANGFDLTIADQAATGTITFTDFDIFSTDFGGPLLEDNAGTIAFNDVLFDHTGFGTALGIIGGTAAISVDADSEIVSRAPVIADKMGNGDKGTLLLGDGSALVIGQVAGGEIDIAADITREGPGEAVSIFGQTGGAVSLTGSISTLGASGIVIDGVGDGASVDITGAVSIEGGLGGFLSDDAISIENVGKGGTVRFGETGSVSISGAADDAIDLENIDGTVAFDGDVTIKDPVDHGVSINRIGATGDVDFGVLSITGSGGDAVDIEGTLDGALSIDDLDISLTEAGTTGVDLSGAVITGTVRATDLDVTATTLDGTIGVDISGTTGTGQIILGDTANAGGESASVSGVAIGVQVSSQSDIDFTYGDGEDSVDSASVIDAVQAIGSTDGPLPTEGPYNFLDVDFGGVENIGSDISNLRGVNVFYVDQDGADPASSFAAGTVQNPGSVAQAQAATGIDAIVLLDTAQDGEADQIVISDVVQGAGASLSLADGQVLLSFATGDAAIDLADFDVVADSLTPPFLFTGVTRSTLIETPDGIDVGPELTTEADTTVVQISGSAGIANTTITATGETDGVVASGFSDAEAIMILDSSISVEGGTALSVVAGTQDVDVILETLDIQGGDAIDIDGSGDGTLTINAFRDIAVARGETSITGVTFDGVTGGGIETISAGSFTGEGLLLDDVTGALDFDVLDIDAPTGLALEVEGSDAGFVLTVGGGSVKGSGIDLEDVDMGITLDTVALGNNGLELDRITGALTITDGTITSNSLQTAIDIGGSRAGSGGDAEITIGADVLNTSGRSILIQELSGGFVSITGTVTDTDGGILINEIDQGTPATVAITGDIDITKGGIELRDLDDGIVRFLGETTIRDSNGGLLGVAAIEFDDTAGRVEIAGNVVIDGTVGGTEGIRFQEDVGDIDITGSVSITGTDGDALFFSNRSPVEGDINITDLDIEIDRNVRALALDDVELNATLVIEDFDVTAEIADLAQQDLQSGPLVFDGPVSRTVEVIDHDPAFETASGAISLTFVADSVDGASALVSKDSNGFDDGGHLTLFLEDGQLFLRAQTEEASLEIKGGIVTPGQEQTVEISWINDLVTLTLDGEVIGTQRGWTGLAPNLEPIVLGASQARSGDGIANRFDRFLDGEIVSSQFIVRETEIAGSVGIDLDGTTGTGSIRLGADQPSANGATIGAGIAIGVNLSGDTDVAFTFGDGESVTGQASILDSTIQINAPTPPTQGSYNFVDVDFGGEPRNVFPDAGGDIVFVAATATGDQSGRNVDNRASIATADAITREGVTFALINDGADIVDTDGFTLDDGQDLDGFGNGRTFTIGQNIPVTFLGVPGAEFIQADPTSNGAAVLGAATTVLTALGNNSIQNIVVSAPTESGNNAILVSGNDVVLGGADGALLLQGPGRFIRTATGVSALDRSVTFRNVEITDLSRGVLLNGASTVDVDRLIVSGASFGVVLFGSDTGTVTLADEATDVLEITNSGIGLHLQNSAGTLIAGAGVAISSTTTSVSVLGGSSNLSFSGSITESSFGSDELVSVSGLHTGRIVFETPSRLEARSGRGLEFLNADGVYSFLGSSTLSGSATRISIRGGSDGTFIFGPRTSVRNQVGASFELEGGTANVTYQGTLSATGAFPFNEVVDISDTTGGSVTFSGQVTALNGATTPINLVGIANTTVTFSGGLTVRSSGAGMFVDSGTINVTGTGNTITSSGGAALVLDGVTANVTFDAINTTNNGQDSVQLTNVDGSVTINGGTLSTVVNGNDFASIDVLQNDPDATRALALTVNNVTFTQDASATSGGSEDGIRTLTDGDDSLVLSINNASFATEDFAVNIAALNGQTTVTGFANNTLLGSAEADRPNLFQNGARFAGVTFDADLEAVGLQAVQGGTFTAGTATTRVSNGLLLAAGDVFTGAETPAHRGEIAFTDYTVFAGGAGLQTRGANPNLTISIAGGSIDAGTVSLGGTLAPVSANITLETLTLASLNGLFSALDLEEVAGSFTVTGQTLLTAPEVIFPSFIQGDPPFRSTETSALRIVNSGANVGFGDISVQNTTDLVNVQPGAVASNGAPTVGIQLAGNTGTFTQTGTVVISGTVEDGVRITDTAGAISFGTLQVTDPGAPIQIQAFQDFGTADPDPAAIDISGTITGTINLGDVGILLARDNTIGLDLGGATLNADVSADDFDLRANVSPQAPDTVFDGTIGIQLAGTTTEQMSFVQIGDTDTGDGNGASIQNGIDNGVNLSAVTAINFAFGDGEGVNDTASAITATTIIGGVLSQTGSYNFDDVVFTGDVSNLTGSLEGARLFFIDPIANNGTGAEGTITNPGSFNSANGAQNIDIFVILAESDAGPNTLVAGTTDHPGGTLTLDAGQSVFGFSTVDANGDTVTVSEIDLTELGATFTPGAPDSFSFTGIDIASPILANPFTTHAEVSKSSAGSSISMLDDTLVKGVSFAAGSPVNQAIVVGSRSNVVIEDVTIRDFTDFGISLFNVSGTNAVRNSVISTNDASAEGLRVLNTSGTLEITDVLFKTADDPANGLNRAVLVDHSFQSFDNVLDLTMTNVDVEGLRAGSGGAIFDIFVDDADGGSVTITESDLVGTRDSQRGLFFRASGDITGAFTDITFSNNRMTGVYATGAEINLGGRTQATLDRITVADNSLLGDIRNGGGIRLFLGSDGALVATTAVGNVSITGNTVGTADQRSQSRGIQYFQRGSAVGTQAVEIRDNVLFVGDGTNTGDTAIEVFVDGTGEYEFAFSDNELSLAGSTTRGDLEALIFVASSLDDGGSVTVTEFSGTTFGEGNRGGVEFFGQDQRPIIFDADPDAAGFQAVNAGDFRLGAADVRVSSDGLNFDDVIGNISFDDLDIFTDTSFALRTDHRGVASDLTLAINADGSNDPTLDSAGNRAFNLDSVTLNADFGDVSGSGGFFRDLASDTGVNFNGKTLFDNARGGSPGLLTFETLNADITFADLEIRLTEDRRSGIFFSSTPVLNGDFVAKKFLLTSESASNTTGVNIAGLTGTGSITLGDTTDPATDTPAVIAGAGANTAGPATGIAFASTTDIDFTFGDGEETEDAASSITAVNIFSGNLPANGTYNFLDVGTFTGDTSGLAVPIDVFFVDQDQAGDGSAANPGSIAGADAFTGDVIALIDTDLGAGAGVASLIDAGATGLDLDAGQILLSLVEGETIDLAPFGVTAGAPASFSFSTASGVGGADAILSAPTGIDTVRPTLTGSASSVVQILGAGAILNTRIVGGTGRTAVNYIGSATGDFVFSGNEVISPPSQSSFLPGFALNFAPAIGGTLSLTGSGNVLTNNGTGSVVLRLASATIGAAGLGFDTVTTNTSEPGTTAPVVMTDVQGGTVTIQDLRSTTTGSGRVVQLEDNTAGFTVLGGSVTHASDQTAIQIGQSAASGSGGSGDILFSAGINSTGATGKAIEIQNRTGGTITFSNNIFDNAAEGGGLVIGGQGSANGAVVNFTGTQTNFVTTTSNAVDLSNFTGGSINFTNGGLGIQSTTGTGFRAVNAGTVTVEDGLNGNTILVTDSGQAVVIENTTIGAAGVEFRAINRFTRAATGGITLDNTGTTGAFVVDSKAPNTGFGGTINTTGGSNVNPLAVTGSAIVNIRGMVLDSDDGIAARFAQTGSDQLTYNLVGNTFRGANGIATEGTVDFQNSGNSVGQGRFLNNVVEHRNRPNPQQFLDEFASGLTVHVSQSGSHTIEAAGNTFNNESALTGGAAFNGTAANFLVAASGPGTLNVTFENNTINGGSNSSTASHIQFGTLNNSPGTACGNFANNRVNVTAFNGNDNAFFASSQGPLAVQLAGSGTSVEQNWINQGNLVFVNGTPFVGGQTGSSPSGSFTFNATCSIPTHPSFP